MSSQPARQKTSIYSARRRAALREAGKQGVRAMVISAPEDVSYLSGFSGEDSFLLLGQGKKSWACLVTDGRFDEQARTECPDIEIHVRAGRASEAIASVLCRGTLSRAGAKAHVDGESALEHPGALRAWKVSPDARRLGVQAEHLTLLWQEGLQKALKGAKLVPLHNVVTALRAVKDAGEIQAIEKAVRIAEQAFLALIAGGVKAFLGKTEREVAAELDHQMRLAGADGPAFPTIVAAGPHGSLPHYRPGGVKIRDRWPVLIDWGARRDGYCSDLTRVVYLHQAPAELAKIHEVVLAAQTAGITAIRPGVAAGAPDAAARRVIESAGYGQRILHSLGHGFGREVHERPSLSKLDTTRLKAGMVVTVEPGLYVPGLGGVRIEDDVVVTSQGRRRLGHLPKSLQAMTLH